jgi:hypothetical protein
MVGTGKIDVTQEYDTICFAEDAMNAPVEHKRLLVVSASGFGISARKGNGAETLNAVCFA